MTDERPRPQYGEYATPEQVAAAMGTGAVPAPQPRVAPQPVVSPDAPADASAETPPLRLRGNAVDRFATIFQLGIGLVFLLNSDYFQFSEAYNQTATGLGVVASVSSTIDSYGWLILGVNILLFLATAVFALRRLRAAKLTFFVPILGFAVFYAFLFTMIGVFSRG